LIDAGKDDGTALLVSTATNALPASRHVLDRPSATAFVGAPAFSYHIEFSSSRANVICIKLLLTYLYTVRC